MSLSILAFLIIYFAVTADISVGNANISVIPEWGMPVIVLPAVLAIVLVPVLDLNVKIYIFITKHLLIIGMLLFFVSRILAFIIATNQLGVGGVPK
jgi:hypothetical protein